MDIIINLFVWLFLSFFFLLGVFALLSPLHQSARWRVWPWYGRYFALALGWSFLIADSLWNVVGGTILYLKLPQWDKNLTFTHRTDLILLNASMDSWRWKLARFMAEILNNIEEDHCSGLRERLEKEGLPIPGK